MGMYIFSDVSRQAQQGHHRNAPHVSKDLKMSMLAEPRRKKKWSVDPRNTTWSKDESKFGHKMLERMGWSKGKGLGKTEQGSTEHIKVKLKSNTLGLGTSTSNEDNWIAHQDDFNQLLADLNNCHGQNTTNEPAQEEKQESFSLEEKSKSCRKRVHYMKFTKGKDLSSRSETDLACIFGKRSKLSKNQDEDSSDSPEELGKEATVTEVTSKPEEPESNTVTSTLSMQEYFAQRMAQLKRSRAGVDQSSTHTPTPSASETPFDSPNISDAEQPSMKKKKKKRRKNENDEQKRGDEDIEAVESVPEAVVAEETAEQDQTSYERKKKKKKKHKTEKEEEELATPVPVQVNCDVAESISTEKKKKEEKSQAGSTCRGCRGRPGERPG
ncbi:PIN2/TERF1-interacting telomerase inhibitor 1 isoform X1 [Clupea harengus]|uniref:PIN2/TERF1-interacting telomerase inhibitor 1 isoform X1 n=2 Tax=Clupea harengus TaxID=7950 RepID=A0A6P3VSI8_CLUHA|nr:PIN2/TERF1-interacting telomerase inhibitor 1 isoform X1 [Clupea harengus]